MSLIEAQNGSPNPAVTRTLRHAINTSRRLRFPADSLAILEMTPTGENLLLTLEDDWDATPPFQSPPGGREEMTGSLWRIRILDRDETTPAIMKTFGVFQIGDRRFKPSGARTLDGSLGIWMIAAEPV